MNTKKRTIRRREKKTGKQVGQTVTRPVEKNGVAIMPYGKHRGKPFYDIPSSYLLWISEHFEEDTKEKQGIVEMCDAEWQYREKYNVHFEED